MARDDTDTDDNNDNKIGQHQTNNNISPPSKENLRYRQRRLMGACHTRLRNNVLSHRFTIMTSTILALIIFIGHAEVLAATDSSPSFKATGESHHPRIHRVRNLALSKLQSISGRENTASEKNCNYECCLSVCDDLPVSQSNGNEILSIKETWVERMLQEINSTAQSNPCPVIAENQQGEGSGIGLPVGVQWLFVIILLALSALFSGLTLGLMSLDPSGLEIVMANSDDPKLARAAKAIYPVRLNGNLLLCTLVLGNVAVNSLVSILMADLTSGLVGFIVSTALIVVFGEIVPQSLCSRFALQVGEKTVPIVKVIIVLFYPLSKPLSLILNKILGHEIGTSYSASEMAKLIEMHVQRGDLEGATGKAMTGALRYRDIPVREVMTPLNETFMLSAGERLGFDVVAKIFKMGFSRIPVYEVSKSNIIGLLFVKDLIFLDPEDEIPVKNFVQIFGRGVHVVWADDKLGDVLKLLKRGGHLALVRDINRGDGKEDPYYEINGIITLEDIIEIILGDDIIDETDAHVGAGDAESGHPGFDVGVYIEGFIEKGVSKRAIDWESRLRLLDERLVDKHLSSDEVFAVAAHLKTNYSKAVELISDTQLRQLLSLVPVTEFAPASSCTAISGGDESSGIPSDSAEFIYERGVSADFCTVVLSGKIVVMSGADRFKSDVSSWGVLASRALTDPEYTPDFSAWVPPNQNSLGGCRCIKLDRKSYWDAVDNTALERTDHNVELSTPSNDTLSGIIKIPHIIPSGMGDGAPQALVPGEDSEHSDPEHKDHLNTSAQSEDDHKTHSRRRQLQKAFLRARGKTE
jgi:metal transporter CNNM